MSKSEQDFFRKSFQVYAEYNMYHRSNSDGYFAIRSTSGFFITATKTKKNIHFDNRRISMVTGYDINTNILSYKGSYLPSSDSVEAALLFNSCNHIKTIIHTHDSVRFTRNNKFKKYVKIPALPYGESRLGLALSAYFLNTKNNFVIMEEHGEIFVGNNILSAVDIVHDNIQKFEVI